MKRLLIYIGIILSLSNPVSAQESFSGDGNQAPLIWQASMGLNFGATSPVPPPNEIDKVFAWYPKTNPVFTLSAIHHFNGTKNHSIGFSFNIERKGFSATTAVKKLSVNLEGETAKFSGNQNTNFDARYVGVMPVFYMVSFLDHRICLYSGFYMNLLLSADFMIKLDGDGTLSTQGPEGKEVSVPLAEGTIVKNSFKDHVRPIEMGLTFGSDFFFTKRLGLSLKFSAGLTSATKDEFARISGQNLHNLYTSIGVCYRFY